MTDRLVVHTRRGVIHIPLTGEPRIDEYLERWARRGGAVLRDGALATNEATVASDEHGSRRAA